MAEPSLTGGHPLSPSLELPYSFELTSLSQAGNRELPCHPNLHSLMARSESLLASGSQKAGAGLWSLSPRPHSQQSCTTFVIINRGTLGWWSLTLGVEAKLQQPSVNHQLGRLGPHCSLLLRGLLR